MFKVIKKHLGMIKVGSKHKIDFPYEDIGKIIRMETPCDCATPTNDVANSKLVVEYKAKDIPQHLLNEGKTSYIINKAITVFTEKNGTQPIYHLVFTATVIK